MASKTKLWNVQINLTVNNFKFSYDLTSSESGLIILLHSLRTSFRQIEARDLKPEQMDDLIVLQSCLISNELKEYKGEFVSILKV